MTLRLEMWSPGSLWCCRPGRGNQPGARLTVGKTRFREKKLLMPPLGIVLTSQGDRRNGRTKSSRGVGSRALGSYPD